MTASYSYRKVLQRRLLPTQLTLSIWVKVRICLLVTQFWVSEYVNAGLYKVMSQPLPLPYLQPHPTSSIYVYSALVYAAASNLSCLALAKSSICSGAPVTIKMKHCSLESLSTASRYLLPDGGIVEIIHARWHGGNIYRPERHHSSRQAVFSSQCLSASRAIHSHVSSPLLLGMMPMSCLGPSFVVQIPYGIYSVHNIPTT